MTRYRRGFSLIELMIVISAGVAIICFIVPMALNARESSKAAEITQGINEIKSEMRALYGQDLSYTATMPQLWQRSSALDHLYDATSGSFSAHGVVLKSAPSSVYMLGNDGVTRVGTLGSSFSITTGPVSTSACTQILAETADDAAAASVGATEASLTPIGAGAAMSISEITTACAAAEQQVVRLDFN